MSKLFSDFWAYLKAVFGRGQQLVFLFFDILGIILIFVPEAGKDNIPTRKIGEGIFFISFLLSNFFLYRKLTEETAKISESSLLMYPYTNPPYDAVEMQYVGPEKVKDLDVKMIYRDQSGQMKVVEVTKFFPQNDPKMIWNPSKIYVIDPNQVLRFHLVQKESTMDGNVTVLVHFVGARSGKPIEFKKEFNLGQIRGVFVG